MTSLKQNLQRKFPCRDQVIQSLVDLLGDPEETFPPCIYLYGHSGTGKTAIVSEFFEKTSSKAVVIDCIECYSSNILFEYILDDFHSHQLSPEDDFAPYMSCDTLKEFLNDLRHANDPSSSYIICLDNAERVRDMEANILPAFMRLPELTGLNICCVLVSQLPFEKYYTKSGLSEVISIYCPQYSKNEVQKILTDDFEVIRDRLLQRLRNKPPVQLLVDIEQAEKVLTELTSEFYGNFLNLFLSVFYKACRDLPELKIVSMDCFDVYVEPVLNGTIDKNDVSRLWRHIAQPLKTALAQVYMRIDKDEELGPGSEDSEESEDDIETIKSTQKRSNSLELPYYTKYLLIAAFLASHNSAKEDKRLFVKHHGKQRKRLQTVNARAKVHEKMSTSLGPKSFSIDRLLAIFYAIIDERVGLTCNLMAQISTLVHLKLLCYVSGENNVLEGSAKLQCTVGLDFILVIGKEVGFDVRQYLCDFM